MAVLDELSGFEFEDVMEDVFRNLGYEKVRQADRRADEGRDLLMEEVVDGTRRAIIVECKHTSSVGRPVVQKLHSAIATFDYDGPKRGMVVTSGYFTNPAIEYTDRLRRNDDPHPIELIAGTDLREIADDIGLDLYNGRIEILCEETLRPVNPAGERRPELAQTHPELAEAGGESIAPGSTLGPDQVQDAFSVAREAVEADIAPTVEDVRERATRAAEVELEEYQEFAYQRRDELNTEIERLNERIEEVTERVENAEAQGERVEALRERKELRSERDYLREERDELRASGSSISA